MLDKYETIEEAVGMPLDKFARIFQEGIYCNDFIYPDKICRIWVTTYKDYDSFLEFFTGHLIDTKRIFLKDYGKTWCLMSEHKCKAPDVSLKAKVCVIKG